MSWQKLIHYDTNAAQVTKEKKMNYVIKPLKKTHYQGQGTELPFEIPAPMFSTWDVVPCPVPI